MAVLSRLVLAGHRIEYEQTGSPICVWHAIGFCISSGVAFPPWVLDYLEASAKNVDNLARGKDFRRDDRFVSPESARSLLGAAFGFKRKGLNVYVLENNRSKRRQDYWDYCLKTGLGIPGKKARKAIATKRNIAQDRSVLKRLQIAKREQSLDRIGVIKPSKPRG